MMKQLSPARKRLLDNALTYGFVIVAYLVLQLMSNAELLSSTLEGQLIPICAYVIMAVSLNLVVGISGELSLGHAGFMSVGAFSGVVATVALQQVIPMDSLRLVAALAVGAVMAGFAGFIIGIPVLRLRGDYLAIVTLAFGEIIKNVINCLYIGVDENGIHFATSQAALVLAEGGKAVVKGPMGASGYSKLSSFTAGFILVLITLAIVLNLVHSRAGRAILALRDNRIAAESVGISATKYKMMAFVTSAVLAGAAGALYALSFGSIAAKKFDFNASILVLVFVVLGGLGNIRGSVIAAALLVVLPELLREFYDYRMLVYAIILILVMLLTNSIGIRQFLAQRFSRVGRILSKRAMKGVEN